MKKIIKSAVLLFFFMFLFVSCHQSLVTLKYKDGKMYNKSAGLEYYVAPTNYQPVSIAGEYAYYKKSDMILYKISGLNPKKWLTQEYKGSATSIFYSTDITLPTLEELDPDKLYICYEDEITYAVAIVKDKKTVSELVYNFINGENVTWPLKDSIQTYEMKFHSDKNNPYIYYNLTYGKFESGEFLYDRNTKRCVEITGLLDDYIE